MIHGTGTALNAATVLVGAGVGVALRGRLPERTRDVVTDGLGLVTLLIAVLSAKAVTDAAFSDSVGSSAPVLIVLGAILIGGIIGSLLRLESRIEGVGAALQRRLSRRPRVDLTQPPVDGLLAEAQDGRARFVEGYVASSLLFVVGPLTILGSLSDGLGHGIDQLALKSVLDGFAAVAFAATLGWGVAASALSVAVVQGSLTALGFLLGDVLTTAQISALTATGGLLLVGVGLRLLKVKQVPVGDLLPALIVAPVLASVVAALR